MENHQQQKENPPKELKKEIMTTIEGLNTFSSIITLFLTRIIDTLLTLTKPK